MVSTLSLVRVLEHFSDVFTVQLGRRSEVTERGQRVLLQSHGLHFVLITAEDLWTPTMCRVFMSSSPVFNIQSVMIEHHLIISLISLIHYL